MRHENPDLPAFLCSARFSKIQANLSTRAALDAIGHLCHPSVTFRTDGAFEKLVVTILKVMGFTILEISQALETSLPSHGRRLTQEEVSLANEKLEELYRDVRKSSRSERANGTVSSRSIGSTFPLKSPLYAYRYLIEMKLEDELLKDGESDNGTRNRFFTDKEAVEYVCKIWTDLQFQKSVEQREPFSPEHAAAAILAYSGGSKPAVINMKKRGSSSSMLPESNRVKAFMKDISEALKPHMATAGVNIGKTHVSPAELDALVLTFSIEPPPTIIEMSQVYQYYRGAGLANLRAGAGDLRLRITTVNKDLVQNMVIARQGVRISNPMTVDEVLQLNAATLKALNKKKNTNDTELSEEMKKAAYEWAHDPKSGQGFSMLSMRLTI